MLVHQRVFPHGYPNDIWSQVPSGNQPWLAGKPTHMTQEILHFFRRCPGDFPLKYRTPNAIFFSPGDPLVMTNGLLLNMAIEIVSFPMKNVIIIIPRLGIFSTLTLWLFNIAMENCPFIDDFPIKTSMYKGFSMAMLNNQMVLSVIHLPHHFPKEQKKRLGINHFSHD